MLRTLRLTTPNRLRLLVVALFLTACLLIIGSRAGGQRPGAVRPPDLVMFIADDMSQSDVAPYGAPEARTPAHARLAREGMTFDHAYAASPTCGPSRAALLTGMMPERSGAQANHDFTMVAGATSLLGQLKARGYDVAQFGKVMHEPIGRNVVLSEGFTHIGAPRLNLDEVEGWLRGRNRTKPLALFVGSNDPHAPWPSSSRHDPRAVDLPHRTLDTPQARINRSQFLEEVSTVDAQLARTMSLVNRYLDPRNTMVVATSDQGRKWIFAKWTLYDAGVRVPLIVRWPGKVTAGRRTAAMVSLIDLLPTYFDAAGAPMPEGRDGRSFAPVLRRARTEHRDLILTSHTGDGGRNVYPSRGARTRNIVYIRNLRPDLRFTTHIDQTRAPSDAYFRGWQAAAAAGDKPARAVLADYHRRPAEELYDLRRDPAQARNLATEPGLRTVKARLAAAVDQYRRETADTAPLSGPPIVQPNDPA